MELILEIDAELKDYCEVKGASSSAAIVTFTGKARGKYFTGETVFAGADTQKTPAGGSTALSARYILKGRDYTGAECSVFIENNSSPSGLTPVIVTDSRALSHWETAALSAEVIPSPGKVKVKIYIL